MIWHEVALRGASSGEFEAQIGELGPFLEQNWRANISPRTGMPIYERPVALVVYREDHRFLLDSIIDRKSTLLNSSHQIISYAVFCLKKKKNNMQEATN